MRKMKRSPAPWKQGHDLITPQTRRWIRSALGASNDLEKSLIFSNLTSADRGRSRRLVCQVRNLVDVPVIVAAPELLTAMVDLLSCIAADNLLPESVSYMKAARAAVAKATGKTVE